jgi:hypothetical protein
VSCSQCSLCLWIVYSCCALFVFALCLVPSVPCVSGLSRSVFCCLFWLYPESERRVSFVVCFGYIQRLKEEFFFFFVKQNKQENSLFFQTLDITKTNNKTHSSFLSLYINKTNNKTHSSFRLCI